MTALGGQDPPANDSEMLRKQHTKRARQFSIEEDGLIRQCATGKLGTPTSIRSLALGEARDSPVGGHFGAQRTTALVQREFFRKGLAQDGKRYVRGCTACHHAKPSNKRAFGLLQPLEIPQRRWGWINVEFITKLPETTPGELLTYGGNDIIINVWTRVVG